MGSFLSKTKKQEDTSSSMKRNYTRCRRFFNGRNQSSKPKFKLEVVVNENENRRSFQGKNSVFAVQGGFHQHNNIVERKAPQNATKYESRDLDALFKCLSSLDNLKEGYESRVWRWLDLCSLEEQSYTGLYTDLEPKQFEPIFNLDVTWDSNINLVCTDSHACEKSLITMQNTKHDCKGGNSEFIPIYNLETKWHSNINLVSADCDSRLESMIDSESAYSSNDLAYDADISSDESEIESSICSRAKLEAGSEKNETGKNDMNMESFFELPAVKMLYFLEVHGQCHDDSNSEVEFEYEVTDGQPHCYCKCHD